MVTLICIGVFVVVVIVIASIIGVAVSDSHDDEFDSNDYMGDSNYSDSNDYQDSADNSGMSDYSEYSDYSDSTDYSEYFDVSDDSSDPSDETGYFEVTDYSETMPYSDDSTEESDETSYFDATDDTEDASEETSYFDATDDTEDASEETDYFEVTDDSGSMPYTDYSDSSEESGFDIVFDDSGTDQDVEIEFEESEEEITCSDLSVVVGAIAEYNGSSLIDPTLMIYIYLLEEAINIGGFSTYFGDDMSILIDSMASAQEASGLGDEAGEDLATGAFWSMWDSFTIDFNSVCPLSDLDY